MLYKRDGTLWCSNDVRQPLAEYRNFKKGSCRFNPSCTLYPQALSCEGLKPERMDYLYKEIALCLEYFADPTKAMLKPDGYDERETAKQQKQREDTKKRKLVTDEYEKMNKKALQEEARKLGIETRVFNKDKKISVLLIEVQNKAKENAEANRVVDDMLVDAENET